MIAIGMIVDFIDNHVLHRGLVIDVQNSFTYVCVVGHYKVHEQPLGRLRIHCDSSKFIDLCRDEVIDKTNEKSNS